MAEENHDREEEANRLVYLQNVYNQQYEALMNELTTFSMAQAALKRNIQVLESKDRMRGSNILVNAEGGTYLEASVKGMGSVMTYVGAGYLVEKGVQEAKEFLTKNMDMGEGQMKRLVETRQKLENELMKIQYQLESMHEH